MNANLPGTFLEQSLGAARETRALCLGRGEIAGTARVFREQFGERRAIIVTAANTLRFAGQVRASLGAANHPSLPTLSLPAENLYAEFSFVLKVQEALTGNDAIPIAVGSGTINDLVKLAAFRTGRPYMCVATAASMDGYTAFGASVTFEGSKQTFSCPAPVAVVADLDVIRTAPAAMAASGYADLISKVTAGADWILADALGVEPIDAQAWNIVQGQLRQAVGDPAGVASGDEGAIRGLTEGLMLGGFAMQWHKSSRPASGAEHQFSHLWDMQHHTHAGAAPSHGFKVGIATLTVTRLYEYLFDLPLQELDVTTACAGWPEREELPARIAGIMKAEELSTLGLRETLAKWISRDDLRRQLQTLREVWPNLKHKLRTQLIPSAELKEMLRAAGAPVEPEEIGISRPRLQESICQAYFIRRRFTLLDLLVRIGRLEAAVGAVFGQDGKWPAAGKV